MRLTRVRVENFRCLIQPVEIAGIDAELTVIAGDNEEGKSTLLQAIRSALFDRYKLGGAAAEAMLPAGFQVAPEIEIDFCVEDRPYALYKRFCQKPTARLTQPDGSVLQNGAAEDALEQQLGFSRPGRGESKPENQGIWGLLWIEQGQSFASPTPGDDARQSLHRVLEAEVGDVLGGAQGQALLASLQQASTEHWTRTWRPSGDYRRAREQRDSLDEQLADVDANIAAYEQKVDQLARTADKLDDYDRNDRLAELQRGLDAANRQAEAIAKLEHAIELSKGEANLAAARAEKQEGLWKQRNDDRRRVSELDEQVTKLVDQLATESTSRQRAETAETEARHAHRAAEKTAEQARGRYEQRLEARRGQERELRLQALEKRLCQARQTQNTWKKANESARQIRLDDDTLTQIKAADKRVNHLETQRQAGATKVCFDVDVAVTAEGSVEAQNNGYLVTGASRFRLAGVGSIAITAGGENLSDLKGELQTARKQLAELLAATGAADAEDAERLTRLRQQHRQDAEAEEKLLTAYAPAGVDALAAECEALRAQMGKRASSATVAGESADLDAAVEAAQQQAQAAADAYRAETAKLERARQNAEHLRARYQQAESALANARGNHRQTEKQLAEQRGRHDDDALWRELSEARADKQAKEQAMASLQAELAEQDPDMVAIRYKRAEKALEQAKTDYQQLQRQVDTLRAELRATGAQGLGEQAEALRAKRATAQRRYQALDYEANAVRVAYQSVDNAAREARRVFLQPVAERVRVYLRGLFGNAELTLDDELRLTGMTRGGRHLDFQSLSIGTREQLAVITRLAFADLLAESGREIPIILDDALVYADDGRFAAMLDVIARAAERHQVIVLTCHESAYRSLGGQLRRLGVLKAG